MRIAVFQFNSTFLRPVLLEILIKIGAKEVYNFWPLPIYFGMEHQDKERLDVHEEFDTLLGLMGGKNELCSYDRLEPVGEDFLEHMAPHEHICKKTIQRWVKIFPDIFNPEESAFTRVVNYYLQKTGHRFNASALTYVETHDIYLRLVRYFHDFFKNKKIDLFLSEFLPHSGPEVTAYWVAKSLDIPTVFGYFTPATTYQYFMSDYRDPKPELDSIIESLRKKYKVDELSFRPATNRELARLMAPSSEQKIPFVGDFKKLDSIAKQSLEFKQIPMDFALSRITEIFHPGRKKKWWEVVSIRLIDVFFKRNFKLRLEAYYNLACIKPNYEANYIYVTLHLQPEASSEPIGEFFGTQQMAVEMLAGCVPEGWLVYVKEHNRLTDHNYRPIRFFENLNALPNVRLIDRSTSTFELIEHSKAVASISSTAGWEGLFKGKPFLMFGYHITMYAPGAYHIRTRKDCIDAIKAIQEGQVDIRLDDLKYYLKALEEISVPTTTSRFQFLQRECTEEEWREMLIEGYINHINKVLGH
jgi:hypothetical protein